MEIYSYVIAQHHLQCMMPYTANLQVRLQYCEAVLLLLTKLKQLKLFSLIVLVYRLLFNSLYYGTKKLNK